MDVIQRAKIPLVNRYSICKVIRTDRGLYNGPNLPSTGLDTLKLCSPCQPGLLHPNGGQKYKEEMRLLIFFPHLAEGCEGKDRT